MMLVMEAELEKTCCHIGELEEERRVMARRLERLLRRMADDRRRTLEAAAALREECRHRLLSEPANAKLERELGDTRQSSPRWSCCAVADAVGDGGGAPDATDGRGLRR